MQDERNGGMGRERLQGDPQDMVQYAWRAAAEHWTVLPGGGHMLSFQAWYLNGNKHREGRFAVRGSLLARHRYGPYRMN